MTSYEDEDDFWIVGINVKRRMAELYVIRLWSLSKRVWENAVCRNGEK